MKTASKPYTNPLDVDRTVALCNLGCSKNQVDGQKILHQCQQAGLRIVPEYSDADVIIVNTCAFIRDAQEEAINTVLSMGSCKKTGCCTLLVVAGCFSQRYRDTVTAEFPEVDAWIGVDNWPVELAKLLKSRPHESFKRILSNPIHTQYLKIADGCSHRCSFCAIPSIRGSFRSRPADEILSEAKWLYAQGCKECIVVSQDTTAYGRDCKSSLVALLGEIVAKTRFSWIRLMYLYPALVTDELLEFIAAHPRVCKYFDIPLQHCADPILKSMRRAPGGAGLVRLIDRIRSIVPDAAIRTSLIVGYPGETAAQFKQLIRFVTDMRFDKLGVFPFSAEEGTTAAAMRPVVTQTVANRRAQELMEVQREISSSISNSRIGKSVAVLIDSLPSDSQPYATGRTQWDAPEVDGTVFVEPSKTDLQIGGIYQAIITDADEYDLHARVLPEPANGKRDTKRQRRPQA